MLSIISSIIDPLLQRDPIFRGLRRNHVAVFALDLITTRPDFQGIETLSIANSLSPFITTRPDFQGIETLTQSAVLSPCMDYNETRFSGDWDFTMSIFFGSPFDYNETRFSGDWDDLIEYLWRNPPLLQRDPIFRGLRHFDEIYFAVHFITTRPDFQGIETQEPDAIVLIILFNYNETRFSGDWDDSHSVRVFPIFRLQRDPIFRGLRQL